MDKIVGIAGVITAMATACAAVVGLLKMVRRSDAAESGNGSGNGHRTDSGTPGEPGRAAPVVAEQPRPVVPPQAWPGSDRPATPPAPQPNPSARSWYQQIPQPAANSWSQPEEPTVLSAIPEQAQPVSGPPNQWWHGAQRGDRIPTPSRYTT